MLINAERKLPEYIEIHGFSSSEYFSLIRAASSLPFIGRGNTVLHGIPYHDILRDYNLSMLMRHVLETDATDILSPLQLSVAEKIYRQKRRRGERRIAHHGNLPRTHPDEPF